MHRQPLRVALAALLSLLLTATAHAATFQGRVVSVADGDTVTVLTDGNTQLRVRLANIDCPERGGQPWGRKAREAAAALVAGRQVRVETSGKDRYERYIGTIYVDGLNVNTQLVRDGHCWVYTRYNQDPALPALQAEAKAAERGLWSLPPAERLEPWLWRRRH
ncbi:MAG TPA: hypothetical protein DD491_05550 [Halieaceae bacterium]|nr:hypothetical protein [Halieaceae bacterium]